MRKQVWLKKREDLDVNYYYKIYYRNNQLNWHKDKNTKERKNVNKYFIGELIDIEENFLVFLDYKINYKSIITILPVQKIKSKNK